MRVGGRYVYKGELPRQLPVDTEGDRERQMYRGRKTDGEREKKAEEERDVKSDREGQPYGERYVKTDSDRHAKRERHTEPLVSYHIRRSLRVLSCCDTTFAATKMMARATHSDETVLGLRGRK